MNVVFLSPAFPPTAGNFCVALAAEGRAIATRYGQIERIECDGEHWLAPAARVRDELHIPGLDAATLARQRSSPPS